MKQIHLKRLRDKSTDSRLLTRSIWRCGELRLADAVPLLIDRSNSGRQLQDYSIAWALGRCGDRSAIPVLKKMHHGSRYDSVQRIAFEALLALADDTESEELLAPVFSALPPSLQTALNDAQQLSAALHAHLAHAEPEQFVVLEQLYWLAEKYPAARQVLLAELRTAPLKPGYFQRLRRIFKAAEFRQDSEVYALLTLRFETTRAYFHRSAWGGDYAAIPGEEEYVRFSKEITKNNARLAYSNRTREYFRRRVWRTLRRLGELDDDAYIELTSAVLLMMSDAQAAKPRKANIYHYDWSQPYPHRQIIRTYQYDSYAGFLTFNHILYNHSQRYRLAPSGRAWIQMEQEETSGQREEAFPELWDRHPEALVQLLTQSQCAPVHQFAARALQDNRDYCQQIDTATLAIFLRQPYPVTAELALAIAQNRYDPAEPDLALLEALLDAELSAARQQALQWIEAGRELLADDIAFIVRLLLNRFTEVRQWATDFVSAKEFSERQAATLIARLCSVLLKFSADNETHAAIAADIDQLLLSQFAPHLRSISLEVIEDLLQHPLPALQILAARLLVNHELDAAQLPAHLLSRLLDSEVAEVRGLGVELFGQLPEQTLLAQAELLSAFCTAPITEVRRSAHAIVQHLAAQQTDYGHQIVAELLPYLYRKEPGEHFHDDLLALLQSPALAAALAEQAGDNDSLWRLLKARAKAAQAMGGYILQHHRQANDLSVRQWAWLADRPLLAARQWAWQSYAQHEQSIKDHAADALRILDSDWDDSREFALQFFRARFDAADWTPDLLVNLCDSVRPDVQAFAQDLMLRFFEEQHGPDYLLKLSQHPSSNVQLFVTQLLEQYAADDVEKLKTLTPYFLAVLSQVNRSRIAKQRILAFLQSEALKNEVAATIIAPIFVRQSATVSVEYKAEYLQAMTAIHHYYPNINLPVVIKPVPVKPVVRSQRDGI